MSNNPSKSLQFLFNPYSANYNRCRRHFGILYFQFKLFMWIVCTIELGTYKKIPQTLGSSVGHGRSFCKDLARVKLKPDMRDDEPLGETRPCGKSRCKTCKMITPTQIAKSASGATIKLRCNTSCKMTNVVYLITCTKCGKQYVGETGDHVNQRMNGYQDDWKHKRFERSPVAEQFCSPEPDFLNHAMLCCLDHNPGWTDRTRKARESYWIRRLNTLRPYGINKGDQ